MKWGVKLLLDTNGKCYSTDLKHQWCSWSPFSANQRWSEDINTAFKVFESLQSGWGGTAEVQEYTGP